MCRGRANSMPSDDGEKDCTCGRLPRGKLIPLLIGITLGCALCAGFVVWITVVGLPGSQGGEVEHDDPDAVTTDTSFVTPLEVNLADSVVDLRQSLYVGVLTLEKYIATRATACNQTWGQSPHISKIEYFAESRNSDDSKLPIVNIGEGENDQSDPYHSRKSFRMLQHVCEHHVERYDWFFRAVDDIYLRVDQLLPFLAQVDQNEKVLIGHSTFPVSDIAYTALEGRMYCLGGAGLVFSRPLLKALCPHLAECERRFQYSAADVELARCVREYVGVECQDSPQNRQYFYHSHEYNELSSMEQFVTQQNAFSLHPVKSTWLMQLLHQHHLRGGVRAQSQALQSMLGYHRNLDGFLDSQQSLQPSTHRMTSHVEEDQQRHNSITFFTDHNTTYNAQACSPVQGVASAQRVELDEAVRRANFSCRLGDSLVCPRMLSGYMQKLDKQRLFEVDMLCHDTSGQHVVSKIKLSKRLGSPQLKKLRKRPMPNDLVLLVTSQYGDPQLLDFLLMVKELARDSRQKLAVFLLLLREKDSKSGGGQHQDVIYTAKELKGWYNQDRYAEIKTHVASYDADPQDSFTAVVKMIQANNSEAIVLVTSPNVHFDGDFLTRCKTITRAGSHIYNPFPKRQVLPSQTHNDSGSEMFDVLWTEDSRPVCIHISDLWNHRPLDKKQLKQGLIRPRKLKVTRSIDLGLQVNVL